MSKSTPKSELRSRYFIFAAIAVVCLIVGVSFFVRPSAALTNGGSITAFNSPLTENFDSLSASGTWTDNSTIPGWYAQFGTTANPGGYTASTGNSGTGALYSFGVAGTNPLGDRALGSVGSGTTGDIFWAAKFANNTGATITSLTVSYVGEEWRAGGCQPTPCTPAAQTVDFQYQVANAGVITDANTPTANWLDHDPLDFTSPVTGTSTAATLDGNAAANRTALSSTITVTVNAGQEIWLRWKDINHANNDHGLAIDDLSVTANGAGSTNPTGVGNANPSSVLVGGTTLLTVNVTPGASPVSTGLGVTADLSSIGGSSTQQFLDDGLNGDVTAGDKVFSFNATVANNTSGGSKTLPATVSDSQGRNSIANIALNVLAPTPPTGATNANPNPVQAGNSTLLTVTVTPGANPTSTGITVTGDLSSIGGPAAQTFFDNGTNGDVTANNNVFSFSATVANNTSLGLKSIPIQIADAQSRSSSPNLSLSVQANPAPPGSVVISQIYGGGGNSGSTLKNDFIEIFNRSANAVDLTGWSVQYASAAGAFSQVTPLTSVLLQPGQYYLVQEAAGGGGSVDLPTPDKTGTINMSASTGKVVLMRSITPLSGANCAALVGNSDVIDFVGYGSSPSCYEGAGPAPTISVTTAALRARNGCKDTDYNFANFTEVAPNPRNTSTATNVCPIGDEAPEIFSTTPANGETFVSLNSSITLDFDQPVNVNGSWFQISCANSGLHTATVTGGPNSFNLDPNIDFAAHEQCTVTIFASQVTDQDTQDPPDNMAADSSFSFNTLIPRDPAEHIVMGNPTGATADTNFPLNYLMLKPQYVLSYNRDRGEPNWTSWHLDSTWLGSAPRQDDFRADDTLPADWYHVHGGTPPDSTSDYSGSGFDRGHMTPSADRTSTIPDNSATFLMTNMVPQAPDNNQGPWEDLESYLRVVVGQGNELYIVSGPQGTGGVGSNGPANTIANGHVTVPAFTWKVVMVLSNAEGDDVTRVNCNTRTFAVIMPNVQGIKPNTWQKYLATVDQVEALTGYDFFSNVPANIQACIESKVDDANDTAPVANATNGSTSEDNSVQITLTATDFNVNSALSFSVVGGGPANGTLGSIGSPTCNNGSCSATVTYTPAADFNGSDTFSFKVNDGDKDSNTANVSLTVSEVNDGPGATNDIKSTDEDSPLTFTAADLTSNDTAGPNEAGQTLTVSSVISTPNTHGSVVLSAGQITYSPDANYNGPASFDYQVCDNGTTNGSPDAKCATGTVNVTVTPVNDAPTANSQSVATNSNTSIGITLTGTDIEMPLNLTFTVTSGPSHGSLLGSGANRTYQPAPNYAGTDSFTFTVTDGGDGASPPLTSSEATVSILVNDTVAPVITLTGNEISLWPLNKGLHTINVADLVLSAADNFDQNVNLNSVVIASVSSDEGTAASGDIVIAGDCKSVQLRQTRNGNGDGRVYTITFRVRDAANNTSFVTAQVTVPHDQGGGAAVDSGAVYTINSSCP